MLDERRQYGSVEEAWEAELGPGGLNRAAWYQRAAEYWAEKEATVEGMLDGLECVTSVDLEASLRFLELIATLPKYKGGCCRFDLALDCGAGIGRVTKGCLLHKFQKVDMVEPIEKFVKEARHFVDSERLGDIYQTPLQDLIFPKKYDCIWLQWCVLYLTDEDLLDLLGRCAAALRPGGVICVKENLGRGILEVDKRDNSIMRTDKQYRELFEQAKLRLLLDMRQPRFPRPLLPVHMYCLRPYAAVPSSGDSAFAASAAATSVAFASTANAPAVGIETSEERGGK